jgi:hypothetical protein
MSFLWVEDEDTYTRLPGMDYVSCNKSIYPGRDPGITLKSVKTLRNFDAM